MKWYENLGFEARDGALLVVLGTLVLFATFGGILGEIGWYGLILIALVAIVAAFGKGVEKNGTK